MPRFAPGETVWTDDPLSPTDDVGAFEVLDVLEDFDEDYTDYVLLLAKPEDRERPFCVSQDRAYHTREEAEAAPRRRDRTQPEKETIPAPKLVRIYSNEHGAWWAPRYCGYRKDPARAGIFRHEEAKARYPYLNYDESEEDYFVDYEFSAKDAMKDMYTLSGEEFCDKYMEILFSDNEEFKAFVDRVNGAVEAVFRERLAEVRPISEDAS